MLGERWLSRVTCLHASKVKTQGCDQKKICLLLAMFSRTTWSGSCTETGSRAGIPPPRAGVAAAGPEGPRPSLHPGTRGTSGRQAPAAGGKQPGAPERARGRVREGRGGREGARAGLWVEILRGPWDHTGGVVCGDRAEMVCVGEGPGRLWRATWSQKEAGRRPSREGAGWVA